MSRIAQIIESMPPDEQKAVKSLREKHALLMELDRKNVIPRLMGKAVLLNYLEGEGRRLDDAPHYYRVPDGKGGYKDKETFFTYKSRINN